MDFSPHLFQHDDLALDHVAYDKQRHVFVAELHSRQRQPVCPTCAVPARRRHSAYTRRCADLPWGERRASIGKADRPAVCKLS